jgi:hypothetical protein
MKVYVLRAPKSKDYLHKESPADEYKAAINALLESVKRGDSRFGWGWGEETNLHKLAHKPREAMQGNESICWERAKFLLEAEKGDWVVYINLPERDSCIAGRIIETYAFEADHDKLEGYRHSLKLDKDSLIEFNRNDETIPPYIHHRLKIPGHYWTIQDDDGLFIETIEKLKSKQGQPSTK